MMIADGDSNVVFVADSLGRNFPEIHGKLDAILRYHDIPMRTISGTRQVWCRDYMPIQVADGRFVQFRYAPDYLVGRYRHLRADGEIGSKFPWVESHIRSGIVLDGGNVVRCQDKVIMTEKIFAENRGWGQQELMAELLRLLEVGRVVVIPPERGDVTGHADGVVRFVAETTVVLNNYRGLDPSYRRVLRRILRRAGLEVLEVPYRPALGSVGGMPSAVGNYINYLRVGRLLVVPCFGLPEDEIARASLVQAHPGVVVETLACRELAMEGGVLNCSTWTIRDNAVLDVP